MAKTPSVAVVGAGCLGVVTLKNFLEEGFEATAFERNDYVGGIWQYTEDENKTSSLNSKDLQKYLLVECSNVLGSNAVEQLRTYDTPDYPDIPIVQSYIEAYCAHFSLNSHIRLKTTVISATPIENGTKWSLKVRDEKGDESVHIFDKVIFATGQQEKLVWPKSIEGLDRFKGRLLHSQAFKRASDFDNQNVLILGSSNTAMDIAVELNGHAKKIYLSHRHGGLVIPRWDKYGLPVEFRASLRLQAFGRLLESISPYSWANFFNKTVLGLSKDAYGVFPSEWRLNKPFKGQLSNPIINDKIVDLLRKERVKILHGIKSITESGDIELSNGDIISDVDTVVCCTGYMYDFSLVPESVNPARVRNSTWDASPRSNGRPLHRLYQGFISLDYPDSLAFFGVSGYPAGQMPLYDLISMALAQIWKGAVQLPPKPEMEAEVAKRHDHIMAILKNEGPQVLPYRMNVGPWVKWLHDVAGTGVNERFSYQWQAWLNWLINRRYISDLMTGVNTPFLWRLFDGRRKKWDGAEEAIKKLNEEMRRRKKEAVRRKQQTTVKA